MDQKRIDGAAKLLLKARAGSKPLADLPAKFAPQGADEAYAIQDAIMRELGAVGGWKVGARSIDAEPACAPLPQSLIFEQGAPLPPKLLRLRGVEAEVAFRMAQDLPPRDNPYMADEVAQCIASAHVTIEIVESRFVDFRGVAPLSVLADSNSNGALIVGPAVDVLSGRYDELNVSLRFDGVEKVRALGGNPAVDLLRLLTWLANHCATRCGGLQRGQIVTTGSHTGMQFAAPGTRVEADFPGFGGVAVTL